MGWAPSISRFLIPCRNGAAATGAFTARSLDRKPKYVAGGSRKASDRIWCAGKGPVVAIVEDVLSAIRVYESGYRACAVLGTSFSQEALNIAVRGCTDVVSWLDPDAAGLAGHKKLRHSLGLHEVRLHRVTSERDPKLHTREEIRNYMEGAI